MLSDDLKKRLSELNRSKLKKIPGEEPLKKREEKEEFLIPRSQIFKPMALDEAVSGGSPFTFEEENFFLVKKEVDNIEEEILFTAEEVSSALGGLPDNKSADFLDEDIQHAAKKENPSILYFDLETCGFSGTPVFLIGFLMIKGKSAVFEQAFARDYSEEKAIVAYTADKFEKTDIVSSYNGKSFDYPFLTERGYQNGVFIKQGIPHIDLLHISKRRWGRQLPNCKLVTLERYILRRNRINDIPGSDIPGVYHNYVESGDAFRMKEVLYHNMMDVITLAEIFKLLFGRNL